MAQAARAEAGRALDAFYDRTTDVKALQCVFLGLCVCAVGIWWTDGLTD